jgi:hypothetical protein
MKYIPQYKNRMYGSLAAMYGSFAPIHSGDNLDEKFMMSIQSLDPV